MIPKEYGVVKVSHAGVEKSGILGLRGGQVVPMKPIIYRVGDGGPKVEKKNKSRISTCQTASVVGNLTPNPLYNNKRALFFETPLGSARLWHAALRAAAAVWRSTPERSPPHESGAK